jgi:hypothetical protein
MKTAHIPLSLLEEIVRLLAEIPAKFSRPILNALDAQVQVSDDQEIPAMKPPFHPSNGSIQRDIAVE